MRMIVPIIGTTAIIVQLIRLWPFTFTSLVSALATGGVFYFACKLGWDTQKGSILKDGYKGWGDWCKRALLGMTVFLTLSLTLLFFSFHNPICKDTGDPFYGRCEKYAAESAETPMFPLTQEEKCITHCSWHLPLLPAVLQHALNILGRKEATTDA